MSARKKTPIKPSAPRNRPGSRPGSSSNGQSEPPKNTYLSLLTEASRKDDAPKPSPRSRRASETAGGVGTPTSKRGSASRRKTLQGTSSSNDELGQLRAGLGLLLEALNSVHGEDTIQSEMAAGADTDQETAQELGNNLWVIRRAASDLHVLGARGSQDGSTDSGAEKLAILLAEAKEALLVKDQAFQSSQSRLEQLESELTTMHAERSNTEIVLMDERKKIAELQAQVAQFAPIKEESLASQLGEDRRHSTGGGSDEAAAAIASKERHITQLKNKIRTLEARFDKVKKSIPNSKVRLKILELEEKIDNLTREKTEAEEAVKTSTSRQEELARELSALNVVKASKDERIVGLQEELSAMTDNKSDLEKELGAVRAEIKVLQDSAASFVDERAVWAKKESDLSEASDALEIEKSRLTNELENMTTSNKSLEAKLKETMTEIQSLIESHTSKETEWRSQSEATQAALQEKIELLGSEIKAKEENCRRLMERNDALGVEVSSLKESNTTNKVRLDEQGRTLQFLKEDNEKLQCEKTELHTRVVMLSERSERLEADWKRMTEADAAQIAKLTAENADREAAVNEKIVELNSITKQLDAARAKQNEMSEELGQKDETVKDQARQMEFYSKELEAASDHASTLESTIATLRDEVASGLALNEANRTQLQNQLDEVESLRLEERNQQEGKLRELMTSNSSLEDEVAHLTSELETVKVSTRNIEAELQASKSQVSTLTSELGHANSKVTDLTNALSALESTVSDLRSEAGSSKEESESLKTALETRDSQISGLTQHLDSAKTSVLSLTAASESLQTQLKLRGEELEGANTTISRLTTELELANTRVTALSNQVESSDSNAGSLALDLANARASLESVRKELEIAQHQVAELTAALNASKVSNEALSSEINEANTKASHLESVNSKMEAQSSELTEIRTSAGKLSKDLESARSANVTLNSQLDATKAETGSLSLEKERLEAQVASLTDKLKESHSQISLLQSSKEGVEGQKTGEQEQSAQYIDLEKQLRALEADRDSLIDELATCREAQAVELNQRDEELTELSDSLTAVVQEREEALSALTALEASRANDYENEKSVKKRRKELESENRELAASVAKLTAQVQELEDQLAQKNSEEMKSVNRETHEKIIVERENECVELRERLNELERSIGGKRVAFNGAEAFTQTGHSNDNDVIDDDDNTPPVSPAVAEGASVEMSSGDSPTVEGIDPEVFTQIAVDLQETRRALEARTVELEIAQRELKQVQSTVEERTEQLSKASEQVEFATKEIQSLKQQIDVLTNPQDKSAAKGTESASLMLPSMKNEAVLEIKLYVDILSPTAASLEKTVTLSIKPQRSATLILRKVMREEGVMLSHLVSKMTGTLLDEETLENSTVANLVSLHGNSFQVSSEHSTTITTDSAMGAQTVPGQVGALVVATPVPPTTEGGEGTNESRENALLKEQLKQMQEMQQRQAEQIRLLLDTRDSPLSPGSAAIPVTNEARLFSPSSSASDKTPDTPIRVVQAWEVAPSDFPTSRRTSGGVSQMIIVEACENVWNELAERLRERRMDVQTMWRNDFDTAKTTRCTPTQFLNGLQRLRITATDRDVDLLFKDMSKRRKPGKRGAGIYTEGTVGVDDIIASMREYCPVDLHEQLNIPRNMDILDDVNDECTFSPRLVSKQSFNSSTTPPKVRTTRASSGANQQRRKSPPAVTRRASSGSMQSPRRSGHTASTRSTADKPKKSNEEEEFNLAAELDKIVGQTELKKQLLSFEHGIELQARRAELGIECSELWPPHMMFLGNPGTGKTTIARLVGKCLKKLKLLKRGHLVEVQRSDLVAGAIGQTALKTKEKISEARGGVLFVDEAYTLAPGGGAESKDFGREAINELMSVMNDGDPVMIFAGYKKEMEAFVRSNAGLFRRIDIQYEFANYSVSELAIILRYEVKSGGFVLHVDIDDKAIADAIETMTSPMLRASMNGGLSRQIFRKARVKLDEGLTLESSPEEMTTITLAHLGAALRDIAPHPMEVASTNQQEDPANR